MIHLLLAAAWASELVLSVEGAGNAACAVAVDGKASGNAPLHVTDLPAGPHAFTFTCLDRDPWTETLQVTGAAGFQQLSVKAPPARPVTTPVEVYLVVRDMTRGEKVKIDGGEPVPLPYHARLVPGPHHFVVLDRAGNVARTLDREVLGNPAGVVLKLE